MKLLLIFLTFLFITISCDKPTEDPWVDISEYIPENLSARANSCIFYDSNLELLYILGGFDKNNKYNELWTFNTNTKKFNKVEISNNDVKPGGRNRYCVFDFQNSYLYMYGLEEKGDASPSSILKFGTITQKVEVIAKAADMPTLRGHSLDLLSDKNGEKSLVVFGGKDVASNYNNDIYIYKLESKELKKLDVSGKKPRPRTYHVSTIYNNKLIIIGGYSGDVLNDIWSFDFKTKTWTLLTKDSPFLNFYAASKNYNYRTKKLYIFGGKDNENYPVSNFLAYDLKDNTFTVIKNNLSKLYGTGISSSEYSIYLFGGKKIDSQGESIFINDFWRYDIE